MLFAIYLHTFSLLPVYHDSFIFIANASCKVSFELTGINLSFDLTKIIC